MRSLKAKIPSHETQLNNKIVYVIEVHDEVLHKVKVSKLRYSQLKEIHEELETIVNKLKLHLILPEFPGRKFLGSTNKSEESILNRKKELTNVTVSTIQYLNDLLVIEKLYCLDLMKKYYIPEEKEQNISTEGINMQICIDRYPSPDPAIH